MKNGAQICQTVDVEKVDVQNPAAAIKTFILDRRPRIVECDVFIAGGGMGGVAAAIRCAQKGLRVCVSEETEWIGGQMTAQGVSAFDENKYVEDSGATRLYQELREEIRNHYRTVPGVSSKRAAESRLNPGDCWVSWLSFEPKVGLAKLNELIARETGKHHPEILCRTKVLRTKVRRGRVESALAVNLDTGQFVEIRMRFCIDATELGDLLPLLGIPYSSGAESRDETGEPHAPEAANPDNVQDFTYPFVLDLRPGEKHRIPKPKGYEEFLKAGKFSFVGFKMFDGSKRWPFWTYRRLIAKKSFPRSQQYETDLSMINWESNDLRGENLIDTSVECQTERLANGKLVSLGFLYWLQTEAPRDDRGTGYPELRLRTDIFGSTDGLSKYPYIRESRRVKATKIVLEQDIAAATNDGARARLFSDSIGIGLYPIDIHGHQDVPGAGQASKPFQIPLGALVQTELRNFIPACKNIGTTHVTNGAYRLHPIEWAIGEAAGIVATHCLQHRLPPSSIQANKRKLRAVQDELIERRSPIFWFDDVPTSDPSFAAIQHAAIAKLISFSAEDLHFRPDEPPAAQDVSKAAVAVKWRKKVPLFSTRRELAEWAYKFHRHN